MSDFKDDLEVNEHHNRKTRHIRQFVLTIAACLFAPIVIAALLTGLFGPRIGSMEILILYVLSIAGAVAAWRMHIRRTLH